MPSLTGMRILLVEDSFLIADLLAAHLEDAGCEIVGPFPSVAAAAAPAAAEPLDGALLDINLGDGSSIPLAEMMKSRDIPMIFLTGYSRDILPPAFADAPCLTKPFDMALVTRLVAERFRR